MAANDRGSNPFWPRNQRQTEEVKRLIPHRTDDFEIGGRVYVPDADFKDFVLLIGEAEARGGVLLKAEKDFWCFSKLHVLNVRRACQKGRKVGTTPGIDQRDAFGICVRQEVPGNGPADHSEDVGTGFGALVPSVEQEAAAEEREKEECALLLHASTTLAGRVVIARDFKR